MGNSNSAPAMSPYTMKMCGGTDGTGCHRFSIPEDALTSGFFIDSGPLNDLMQGVPIAAVQLENENIWCGVASQQSLDHSGFWFSQQRCAGTKVIMTAQDGVMALPEGLSGNVQCIGCFVSPTSE